MPVFWLRVWAGTIDVVLEASGALVLTVVVDFFLRRFGRLLGFSAWDSKFATGMSYILLLAVGSCCTVRCREFFLARDGGQAAAGSASGPRRRWKDSFGQATSGTL